MSKDQKGNTLQYMSNNCILVINQQGKIRELFTPFLVSSSNNLGARKRTYIVEEVLSTPIDSLIYVINGRQYDHAMFVITINF
jgi:hypothetical protein